MYTLFSLCCVIFIAATNHLPLGNIKVSSYLNTIHPSVYLSSSLSCGTLLGSIYSSLREVNSICWITTNLVSYSKSYSWVSPAISSALESVGTTFSGTPDPQEMHHQEKRNASSASNVTVNNDRGSNDVKKWTHTPENSEGQCKH